MVQEQDDDDYANDGEDPEDEDEDTVLHLFSSKLHWVENLWCDVLVQRSCFQGYVVRFESAIPSLCFLILQFTKLLCHNGYLKDPGLEGLVFTLSCRFLFLC